jgi:Nitroreductase family
MSLIDEASLLSRLARELDQAGTAAAGSRPTDPAAAGLAPAALPPTDLDRAAVHRRSTRDFSDRPVPARTLREIASQGLAWERALWPSAAHGDAAWQVIVAMSEPPVEAGSEDRSASAIWFAPRAVADELVDRLRIAYAPAPAYLLVCGTAMPSPDRTDGTTHARLLRAGASLAYASWLTALTSGLSGCIFGRRHASVSRLARTGDPGASHVTTLALGFARDGDDASYPATALGEASTATGRPR